MVLIQNLSQNIHHVHSYCLGSHNTHHNINLWKSGRFFENTLHMFDIVQEIVSHIHPQSTTGRYPLFQHGTQVNIGNAGSLCCSLPWVRVVWGGGRGWLGFGMR